MALSRLRRQGAAAAAHLVGARTLAALARVRALRALCLNYHVIDAETLRSHLAVLLESFEIVPLDEAWRRAAQATPRQGRLPLALTFDDGKRSHLTQAAGVLRERAVPATFFVTTGPSRSGTLHWFDLAARIWSRIDSLVSAERTPSASSEELRDGMWADMVAPPLRGFRKSSELKRLDAAQRDAVLEELAASLGIDPTPANDDERPLTPEEVARLAELGFEVGSHSVTHPILPLEDEARVWHELSDSRSALEEWVGRPVRHFAYPNGNSSDGTERLTRKAGYETAWCTFPLWLSGRENAHRLPRLQIHAHFAGGDIALKCAVSTFPVLGNPDGSGRAYLQERHLRGG